MEIIRHTSWVFIALLCSFCSYAQPSYLDFVKNYEPHNKRPGKDEAAVIMMNTLPSDQTASFLKKYWQEGDKEMVFALLISLERVKAAKALEALDQEIAIGALNYMPEYWALDFLGYLSPYFYLQISKEIHALQSYQIDGNTRVAGIGAKLSSQSNSTYHMQGLIVETVATSPINLPSNILFYDDFQDNRQQWEEEQTFSTGKKITNGHYHLMHSHYDGGYFYDRGIYIDSQKDFYIETSIKEASVDNKASFGISWGRTDTENYYTFSINTQSGAISIRGVEDGKELPKPLDAVVQGVTYPNQYNVLAVQKEGELLNFFINRYRVHQMPYRPFYGHHIGLVILGKATIDIDYFKVQAPPPLINTVANTAMGYQKESLGNAINTTDIEYGAVVAADGQTIYFSRRSSPKSESDIWYSQKTGDNTWSTPKRMPFPINNHGNNSVVSVSPDGNTLILNNRYTNDGLPKGKGISMTHYTENGWSIPKDIPINNYYNRLTSVSHALSPDGQALIMAVNREDAVGNLDLYVSFLKEDSSWTEPKNLGATINTKGQESGPFIAPDNRTLYFATDGLAGYGNADIFVTRRLDDSWLKWSEPQNLGPEINSVAWDSYYTVPADGRYAYMSSYTDGKNRSDIYRIPLAVEARPTPVVLLKGRIYDANTKLPLGAQVIYKEATTGKVIGKVSPSPNTGEYKMILPYGKVFDIRVIAPKYLSGSISLDLKETAEYQAITQDFALNPLEIGKSMRINNIFFERGKAVLLPHSAPELDRIAALMKEHPNMKVRIEGHTDGIGDPKQLLQLSWERATAVKDYLISQGIHIDRIEGKGYGKERPIAPNNSEENRQKNRRVELMIMQI